MFGFIDSVTKRCLTLDAVCMGVACVQLWVERKSERSSPSFHTSLQAYVCDWSRRAGRPKLVRYDRGMHDRGVFSSILIENGAMIRPAGSGIPEQISRAGQRGDISKKTTTKAIKDTHASGRELEDLILGECLPSYREKNMQILRSMGSRRTNQTHRIEKGCTCDRISTNW